MIKGSHCSIEQKQKMRLAKLGKKHTPEHSSKISIANKGRKNSDISKMNISMGKKGKPNGLLGKKRCQCSEETKKKISKKLVGYKPSKESREKHSKSIKGDKSHFWKGGLTSKNKLIRGSIEYRLWREAVFSRDNWTCQKTRIKGGKIHPHHIQNFAQYPELRFAIDNGITLSEKSHREFHKIYGRRNNTKEQLEEYLKK